MSRRLFVAAAAVCMLGMVHSQSPLCPFDAVNGVCVLTGTYSGPVPLILFLNGSLVMVDYTINMPPCEPAWAGDCSNSYITIIANGNITLQSTSIVCPSVVMSAINITLDALSNVTGDGAGPPPLLYNMRAWEGLDGTGGGHGGGGSSTASCRDAGAPAPPPRASASIANGQAFGFTNISQPFDFGGGTTMLNNPNKNARGGGRIWLEAVTHIGVHGTLSVQGAQVGPGPGGNTQGAGAGGSIYLGALNVSIQNANLLVSGGSSVSSGAGGGGIISIVGALFIGLSTANVDMAGGATLAESSACPIGGTGLWYRRILAPRLFRSPLWIQHGHYMVHHPLRDGRSLWSGATPEEHTRDAEATRAACRVWARGAVRLYTTPDTDGSSRDGGGCGLTPQQARARGLKVKQPQSEGGVKRAVGIGGGEAVRADPRRCAVQAVGAEASGWPDLFHPLPPLSPSTGGEGDGWDWSHHDVELVSPAGSLALEDQIEVAEEEEEEEVEVVELCEASFRDVLQPQPEGWSGGDGDTPTTILSCQTLATYSTAAPMTAAVVTTLSGIQNVVMTNCAWDLSQLSQVTLASLQITSSNIQTASITMSVNGSAMISALSRVYTAATGSPLRIYSNNTFTLKQSLVDGGSVELSSTVEVDVALQGYVRFVFGAVIASTYLEVTNMISQVDIPPTTTYLTILVQDTLILSNAYLVAGRIVIEATNSIAVAGAVTAVQGLGDQNGCPGDPSDPPYSLPVDVPCNGTDPTLTPYFMWLAAPSIDVQKSGNVAASVLRVCSAFLTVEGAGSLNADGLGCGPETGWGAGVSMASAPASGAGHGGKGGAGVSLDGPLSPPGPAVDNASAPVMVGSGGGDVLLGGSGGGFIWLDVPGVIENDGIISAKGTDGSEGETPMGGGGGGGSGGTLVMRLYNLSGVPGSLFDFSGGEGSQSGNGGGGGGIINVQWLSGTNQATASGLSLLPVGGGGGGTGAVVSSQLGPSSSGSSGLGGGSDSGAAWYQCLSRAWQPPTAAMYLEMSKTSRTTDAGTGTTPGSPSTITVRSPSTGTSIATHLRQLTFAACEHPNRAPQLSSAIAGVVSVAPPTLPPTGAAAAPTAPTGTTPAPLPLPLPRGARAPISTPASRTPPPLSSVPGNAYAGSLHNNAGVGLFPGQPGEHGVSVSSPSCALGEGGALCLSCSPGTFKNVSASNAPCSLCTPGFYANATGAQNCTQCSGATVSVRSGADHCTACPPGFLPNANFTSCALCEVGHGGPGCIPCQPGSFKNTTTRNECTLCPPGSATEGIGSLSCSSCPPGQVAPQPGTPACGTCPIGSVPNNEGTKCAACPPGSFASEFSHTCQPCQPNTYSTNATLSCNNCDAGEFSLGNATKCLACPPKPMHAHWQVVNLLAGVAPHALALLGSKQEQQQVQAQVQAQVQHSRTHSQLQAQAAYAQLQHTHSHPSSELMFETGSGSGSGSRSGEVQQVVEGICAFACDSGYVDWPQCVTPVLMAFNNIGGTAGIVCFTLISLLILLPAWWVHRQHGARRTLHAWVPDTDSTTRNVAAELDAYWGVTQYENVHAGGGGGDRFPRCRLCGCGSGNGGGSSAALSDDAPSPGGDSLQHRLLSPGGGMAMGLSSLNSGDGMPMSPHGSGFDVAAVKMGLSAGGFAGLTGASAIAAHDSSGGGGGGGGGGGESASSLSSVAARSRSWHAARLAVADLARHIHRVYYTGNNSPFHPLQLEAQIPDELAKFLVDHEFVDHVEECNGLTRWRPWEVRIANLLRALYHPLALLWEKSRRVAKVAALVELYGESDHTFLKNTRARALGNCVHFGYSHDYTLAWIDILVTDATENTGGVPVGQPRYPAVILCAGDGSFPNPFHIELSDTLNVALASLVGPDFQSIITGLNNVLRQIRGPTMSPGLRVAPRYQLELESIGVSSSRGGSGRRGGGGARTSLAAVMLARDASLNRFSASFGGGRRRDGSDSGSEEESDVDNDGNGNGGREEGSTGYGGDAAIGYADDLSQTGCCTFYGQNNLRALVTQPASRAVQEYLQLVNETLQDRATAATRALDTLARRRAHSRKAAAAPTSEQPHPPFSHSRQASARSYFPDMSATLANGGNSLSPTAAGAAGVVSPLDTSVSSSGTSPQAAGLVKEEGVAVEALRWVPLGFPETELAVYLGSAQFDSEGRFERPCLVLLPRGGPLPGRDGALAYDLPYGASILPLIQAGSLFSSLKTRLHTREASMDATGGGGGGFETLPGARGGGGNLPTIPSRSASAVASGSGGGVGKGYGGGAGSERIQDRRGVRVRDMSPHPQSNGSGGGGSRGSGGGGGMRGMHGSSWSGGSCAEMFRFLVKCTTRGGHYFPALRNSRASGSWEIATVFLQILLTLEFITSAMILTTFFVLQLHIVYLLLALPPLMTVIAPFLGHAALAFGSPTLHRVHASMELHTLIGAVAGVVAGAVYCFHGPLDYTTGIILPLALLILKIAILRFTNTRIALLDLQQESVRFAPAAVLYVRDVLRAIREAEAAGTLNSPHSM